MQAAVEVTVWTALERRLAQRCCNARLVQQEGG